MFSEEVLSCMSCSRSPRLIDIRRAAGLVTGSFNTPNPLDGVGSVRRLEILHRKTNFRKYRLASKTIGDRYGGSGVMTAPDRLNCGLDRGEFYHGNASGPVFSRGRADA